MITATCRTGLGVTVQSTTPAAASPPTPHGIKLTGRIVAAPSPHSLPAWRRPVQALGQRIPGNLFQGRQLLTFGPTTAAALGDVGIQPAVPAAAPVRLSYGPCPAQQASTASPASSPASSQPFVRPAAPTMRSAATPTAISSDDVVRVAAVGDLVTIHYTCRDPDGALLETSKEDEDGPVTFEVGAGDIVGNVLFQGFDEAVRGLAVGQTTVLEAEGGEWKPALLFAVPEEHPEITRLQGRYKSQGGLKEGMIVELANGGLAVVVSLTGGVVKIDANNMLAGKQLVFELEVVKIEQGSGAQ